MTKAERLAEEYGNLQSKDKVRENFPKAIKILSESIANHFLAGFHSRDEEVKKLRDALKYIVEHELYHGLNQGKTSEEVAMLALEETKD